jgi:hypothetical protein
VPVDAVPVDAVPVDAVPVDAVPVDAVPVDAGPRRTRSSRPPIRSPRGKPRKHRTKR